MGGPEGWGGAERVEDPWRVDAAFAVPAGLIRGVGKVCDWENLGIDHLGLKILRLNRILEMRYRLSSVRCVYWWTSYIYVIYNSNLVKEQQMRVSQDKRSWEKRN